MIEPLADLGDRGLVVVGQIEVGTSHPRPIDEQFQAVLRHAPAARQRGHRPHVLASYTEWRLTRCHHRDPCRGLDQPIDDRSDLLEQVLAVVDDQQAPRATSPTRTRCRAPTRPVVPALPTTPARLQPREAPPSSAASDANHTPSLNVRAASAATCNANRDLPTPPGPVSVTSRSVSTSIGELFHLVDATHEARALHRQIPRQRIKGPQPREVPGSELPDQHGAAEIAQAMLTQVAQHQTRHESSGHRRDQHLSTVTR